MKIIDIGICIDNNDPKGIGRIRYKPRGLFQSEIERSVEYEQWDENDPFLLIPFLPLHINVIPQKEQSVKILKYDTDKQAQNMEYIAGPFTSSFDLLNQTFLQQHRDTTYGGNIVKDIKDIREKNGDLKNKLSNGAILKSTDTGVKGNYGSDIIFTENGMQLRGGMLVSKNNGDKKTNLDFPIMSKKMGRFTLKKFQKSMELKEETDQQTVIPIQRLNYIVEYEVNDISNPTNFYLYVYKVIDSYGDMFNSNVFDDKTDISDGDIRKKLKLINTGNTDTGYTLSIPLNGGIVYAYTNIRSCLYKFYENQIDLSLYDYFNDMTLNYNLFPFYFRPTISFRKNNIDISSLINNVKLKSKVGYGLIFSHDNVDPQPKTNNVKVLKLKEVKNSPEQSFSSLSADKIYFTSTSPNGTDKIKTINFDTLDKYELTQEDYLKNIEPNTYALVRGDVLLEWIRGIYNAFGSHIHQINKKPIIGNDSDRLKLDKLMETIEDELLNKSIRIN